MSGSIVCTHDWAPCIHPVPCDVTGAFMYSSCHEDSAVDAVGEGWWPPVPSGSDRDDGSSWPMECVRVCGATSMFSHV